MSKKIIALVINAMSVNDKKLFMIDEFKKSDINFEIYDLSPLIYNKSLNTEYSDYTIDKIADLRELLKTENNFMIYFNKNIKLKPVFDLLEEYSENNYYKLANGKILVGIPYRNSFLNRLYKAFNKTTLIDFIYRKTSKELRYTLFESGISKGSIEIPSFEYDNYLKLLKTKGAFKKDYHVFLDNDMVFHRDVGLGNVQTVMKPEEYYLSLRTFFDNVEKATNKKVIIALHPRTAHKKYDFGDRQVVLGNTAELMWDADLTFSHHSTSSHYAIIYDKDLLLLTTDELDKSDVLCSLERFEDGLNLNRININHFSDFNNIYKYANHEKYENYKELNIISNNIDKDQLGSDIIIEYFNKIFKES